MYDFYSYAKRRYRRKKLHGFWTIHINYSSTDNIFGFYLIKHIDRTAVRVTETKKSLKLQLHGAIYRLRFYFKLVDSYLTAFNNVASIQRIGAINRTV